MGLVITLILVGLVFLFAEIVIIPGVGVAGIIGLLSLGGSVFYAFHSMGSLQGYIVLGINVLLLLVLVVWVLRAKSWKRLTLNTVISSKAVASEIVFSVGERGKTLTRLAPAGSVRFRDSVVEARAIEGMLDSGEEVEVVLIEDGKIYVRKTNV